MNKGKRDNTIVGGGGSGVRKECERHTLMEVKEGIKAITWRREKKAP